MIVSLMVLSLTASAPGPAPQLHVSYAGVDFTDSAQVVAFDRRLEQAVGDLCTRHRTLVTPSHVTNARFCEQSLRAEVLRRLPREDRRNYRLTARSLRGH